jgi:hypothetical protein
MRHRYVYAVEFEAHFTLPTDLSGTVNDNIELVIYDNMTKI